MSVKIKILELKEEYKEYETRPNINCPEKVYNLLKPLFPTTQEALFLLSLNTKNGVIAIRTVFLGSLNANITHPREIFKAAIIDGAANIIIAHNHPSGDPTPSREDIEITKKINKAGKIIGITLLDHVIIGDGHQFSMKESGHF